MTIGVMQAILTIFAGIFGAIFGSFACCQAWRLHERGRGKKMGKWSRCMHCDARLEWFDNIPIISWLILRGRCRKCHQKIGFLEFASEIAGAAVFVLGYLYFSPIRTAQGVAAVHTAALILMIIFMTLSVLFIILAVYDFKWKELPTSIMITANFVGFCYFAFFEFAKFFGKKVLGFGVDFGFFLGRQTDYAAVCETCRVSAFRSDLLQLVIAVGVLAGVYYLLYKFSHEKLVGGGDFILALAISFVLSNFALAIMELFLSNLLAAVFGYTERMKKRKKVRQIPFGPFLIAAFYIVFFCSNLIIKYLSVL